MFTGDDIRSLVELFEKRGVVLYHACQLVDFQSYLKLGGIPSRECLARNRAKFTEFETDSIDKDNKVWDKVFLNLSDFGKTFASSETGLSSVPNPYGPILICLKPEALIEATDVAICLRSAGAKNFNRDRESLRSIDEINRLFYYSDGSDIKFKNKLRTEFSLPAEYKIGDPEISCSTQNGLISLENVKSIIVDGYVIGGRPLINLVKIFSHLHGINQSVIIEERCYKFERKELLSGLTNLIVNIPRYEKIREQNGDSPKIVTRIVPRYEKINRKNVDFTKNEKTDFWLKKINDQGISYQLDRFTDYTIKGTLIPMIKEADEFEIEMPHYGGVFYEGWLQFLNETRYIQHTYFYKGFSNIWVGEYKTGFEYLYDSAEVLDDSEYSSIVKKFKDFIGLNLANKNLSESASKVNDKSDEDSFDHSENWIEYAENLYEDQDALFDEHPEAFGYIYPDDLKSIKYEIEESSFRDGLLQYEDELFTRLNLADRDIAFDQILKGMDRIGWNKKNGKEYLHSKYGKILRSELSKDEWIQFVLHLASLPSKVEQTYDDVDF